MVWADWQKKAWGREQKKLRQESQELERDKFNQKWISQSALKRDRNWTDSMIKLFLPTPTLMHGEKYGKKITFKLYLKADVLKIEKSHSFKILMKDRVEKQSKRELKNERK